MALIVERKRLGFWERTYLPQIISGLYITIKNFFAPKITLEYPDQRPILPKDYRGAPVLIRDSDGRSKCVSCQLCEFVCPSKAIKVYPSAIDPESEYAFIEKGPSEFEIDMTRCIYCGMCQEACPEQAIVMSDIFSINGYSRAAMVRDRERLYSEGGVVPDKVMKWRRVLENSKKGK